MAKSVVKLFQILILQLCILQQFLSAVHSIRTSINIQKEQTCRNTVQGRYLLSDDNGHVCDALSVDPWSRCCPESGKKFSCHGCNLVSQCCNSYEYCVSCCLSPAQTQKELAVKVKIAKPVTAGTYASVFDFCAGRCRHSSESVVHENAYISDFHHCFSLPSNASGAIDTHSEARLSGITVLIGRQGESCESVCKLKEKSCVPGKLMANAWPALEQINLLKLWKTLLCICIQELACTLELKGYFHVKVHIGIQGDSALAHDILLYCNLKFMNEIGELLWRKFCIL
ncbi:hypothetical protein FRX31_007351 [Thalictrum thalictroides]|uniref:SREBP regulating gene protein n=1 Tax=Thalictrum thalictroides TaxID=46969 RepID=A0A7J6X011_THATH|nr:hypothetical protein FRX31_007351 [Thalictrum thalictroides]